MPRRRAYQPVAVLINNRRVGILDKQSNGAISFDYAQEWLEWQHAFPVSLSLPLSNERYSGGAVAAVFENLLPDSARILTLVAQRVGAQGSDAFSLLSEIGRDCVGAMQFLPVEAANTEVSAITGAPVGDAEIERLLKNLVRAPLGIDGDEDFRISVAGAQEKTALLWHCNSWLRPSGTTPTTHILKPQIGHIESAGGTIDLSHSVENEHYCLTLLRGFGLKTANTRMETFGSVKTLVIERFDRRWTRDDRLLRLPQEDFCQALSVHPTVKYQNEGGPGIVQIMTLLQGSDDAVADRLAVFKAHILFWLIGAPDGHAKNFSVFLKPGGRFSLTPFYDVLTGQLASDTGQIRRNAFKLAMSAGDNRHYRMNELSGRHFMETGREAGLSVAVIKRVFSKIHEASRSAFETAGQAMPAGFPTEISTAVEVAFNKRLRHLD
ncbi:MAG: type II toxin-antitoxin system HipA family toxin [Alteraurantiacibacter sp.]